MEQVASFLELDVEAAAAAAKPGVGVGKDTGGSSGQHPAHRPFAMDGDSADGLPGSEGGEGTTQQRETKKEQEQQRTTTTTRSSTPATAEKTLVRTRNMTFGNVQQQRQLQQQRAAGEAGTTRSEAEVVHPLGGALGERRTPAPGAPPDEASLPQPLAPVRSLARLPTAMGRSATGPSRLSLVEAAALAAGEAEGGVEMLEGGQGEGNEEEEEEGEGEEAEVIWTFGQDEGDWYSGGERVLDSILADMMAVRAWC